MSIKCKCGTNLHYDHEEYDGEECHRVECVRCDYRFDLINVSYEVFKSELMQDLNEHTPKVEHQYKVDFQAIRDSEIAYFMPKGFGSGIDNCVINQRKQLLKSIRDKHNGFWVGHNAFRTLVELGLVEDKKPSRLTIRGKIFLQQGLEWKSQTLQSA